MKSPKDSSLEKSEKMEIVEGTKYFNIVFDDDKGSPDKMADCLVIFNGSRESLTENNVNETRNVEKEPQGHQEFGRESEKNSQHNLQLGLGLKDGSESKTSAHISSSYDQQPDDLALIEKNVRSLVISELKSRNASPVTEKETLENDCLASGRSSKQSSRMKSSETTPSASENLSKTSLPRNNNSQKKKSFENQSAGDFSTESGEQETHAVNRTKNSTGRDDSFSYDDSDESIVSIAKIQSDRGPCSSGRNLSSAYSSESSSASGQSSSGSTYTLSDPGYTSSTANDDHYRNHSHGNLPKSKAKPDILVINHSHHDSGARTRVPVFLRAEAVLQNGELEVTVKDERNSCPVNVNVKVTVLHGPSKKKVSSKFAAYRVVPRIPRAPAVDRDIVKHRAMRPPFNTHINPEAAQRHRRHFGLE